MAFPASPSNNQVHKEGNRSFVYDSTLGTWDQVPETDSLYKESGGGVLGNINAGTLGSGVTFPAGHIVQTSAQITANTRTSINVGNNSWVDTVVTGTFKPIFADSDVIVHTWYVIWINNTSGDGGAMSRFKRVTGGVTTYPSSLAVAEATSSNGTRYMHIGGATVAYVENFGTWHSLIDQPATNSDIHYTLQCAEYNAEDMYCGAGNGTGARWHIWFQEVKRN